MSASSRAVWWRPHRARPRCIRPLSTRTWPSQELGWSTRRRSVDLWLWVSLSVCWNLFISGCPHQLWISLSVCWNLFISGCPHQLWISLSVCWNLFISGCPHQLWISLSVCWNLFISGCPHHLWISLSVCWNQFIICVVASRNLPSSNLSKSPMLRIFLKTLVLSFCVQISPNFIPINVSSFFYLVTLCHLLLISLSLSNNVLF